MTTKKSKGPLIAAAAVGLGIYLWRAKKAKAKPTIIVEPEDDDDEIDDVDDVDKPPPPPGKGPGWIPDDVIGGDPGYSWQPRSSWKTFGEIAGGFSALGYNVPPNYGMPNMVENPQLMLKMKPGIKKFQADYKHAVKWLTKWPQLAPDQVLINGKNAPVKSLTKDGWIGPNTWKAFKWAYKGATRYPNLDVWQGWVTNGKGLD